LRAALLVQCARADVAAHGGNMAEAINLAGALSRFTDHWSPKIVAAVNDYDVKVVKVQGEFVRHSHDDTDELFLVLHGAMTIKLPAGDVHLREGDLFVVPRGVEHQPFAAEEAHVLLLEPRGTLNTGDAPNDQGTTGERL
jgi:mannose-6-phosphate isomerase-like protein (cupin superfamily)